MFEFRINSLIPRNEGRSDGSRVYDALLRDQDVELSLGSFVQGLDCRG